MPHCEIKISKKISVDDLFTYYDFSDNIKRMEFSLPTLCQPKLEEYCKTKFEWTLAFIMYTELLILHIKFIFFW